MGAITKQWSVGGGSATIQYDGQGDGNIIITSDANSLYETRSMQITIETTNGSPKQTRTITINQAAKQRIDLSTAIVAAVNQTYSGSAKTPTPTVTLNGNTVPSTGYDVAYSNNINAGTATITVTGKNDYTGTATGTFTINQATGQVTTAPTARTVTYSGSSQYLVTAGSGTGTMYYRYRYKSYSSSSWGSWSSYSTGRPSRTNAGYYEVEYYAAASSDGNYTASATGTVSCEIYRASRTVSWSSYPSSLGVLCSGTLSATVSAGSGDGTISYSSGNTSRATISGSTVTAKSTGTVTITATVSAGTNYGSASKSYTLTVTNYVNLGLSSGRLWATGNIVKSGSSYSIGAPTDYGCYFSFGNIDGHNSGDGYNFGTSVSGPYASTPGASVSSDISSSDSSHDAARARLGSPYYLPSLDDANELWNGTDHEQATISGIKGMKFMKKTDHNIFIFIPLAGIWTSTTIGEKGTSGRYWTSKYYSSSICYSLDYPRGSAHGENRYAGCPVRAVR